jgi:hypothetical protein
LRLILVLVRLDHVAKLLGADLVPSKISTIVLGEQPPFTPSVWGAVIF